MSRLGEEVKRDAWKSIPMRIDFIGGSCSVLFRIYTSSGCKLAVVKPKGPKTKQDWILCFTYIHPIKSFKQFGGV